MNNSTLNQTLENIFSSSAMTSTSVNEDSSGEAINKLRADVVQLAQLLGDQIEKEKVLQDVVSMYQSIDSAKKSLMSHALNELTTRQDRIPYDVKRHRVNLVPTVKKVGKIDLNSFKETLKKEIIDC
tara:strand:+ start:1140 stop:1520 length:381 start_codon:yes stop_codon:yes gene_type:complete